MADNCLYSERTGSRALIAAVQPGAISDFVYSGRVAQPQNIGAPIEHPVADANFSCQQLRIILRPAHVTPNRVEIADGYPLTGLDGPLSMPCPQDIEMNSCATPARRKFAPWCGTEGGTICATLLMYRDDGASCPSEAFPVAGFAWNTSPVASIHHVDFGPGKFALRLDAVELPGPSLVAILEIEKIDRINDMKPRQAH